MPDLAKGKTMKSNTDRIHDEFPEFASEVQSLETDALKARIVSLQQALEESDEAKEADEGLKEAKAAYDLAVGPYRDIRKAVRMKTKFLIDMLKDRG
jgi:hypothetical protein